MTLGQEIRYYRKKKGLTQTAFGALFGMSKQAVYSWETGLYSPDISVLLKMADFFPDSHLYPRRPAGHVLQRQ